MISRTKQAVVLWTGGKDSCLALHWARDGGYQIQALVTFTPPQPSFLAHPLKFMSLQAEALGLPHHLVRIDGDDKAVWKTNYSRAIERLRSASGVNTLVTGDIAEVGGEPNWVRECCRSIGVDVQTPLWGKDRRELVHSLLSQKFEVIFSCVKKPWFTEEWLGLTLDETVIDRLMRLASESGMDLCGEQGEYHTLVLDAPLFRKRIRLGASAARTRDSLMHLEFHDLKVEEKRSPREKICPKCGRPFLCGPAHGESACWCSKAPHLPPPLEGNCYCAACLEAEVIQRKIP